MRDILFQLLQQPFHPLALKIGGTADRATTADYRQFGSIGKADDIGFGYIH